MVPEGGKVMKGAIDIIGSDKEGTSIKGMDKL